MGRVGAFLGAIRRICTFPVGARTLHSGPAPGQDAAGTRDLPLTYS